MDHCLTEPQAHRRGTSLGTPAKEPNSKKLLELSSQNTALRHKLDELAKQHRKLKSESEKSEALLTQQLDLSKMQLKEQIESNESQRRMYDRMISALQVEDSTTRMSSTSLMSPGRDAISEARTELED